jgi:hypothetical protein
VGKVISEKLSKPYSVPYKIPNLPELLSKTLKRDFKPVKDESGWRVVINDVWVCKTAMPGTPKRVYASEDAARQRTEEEFSSNFRLTFHLENKDAYDSFYHYVDKQDYYNRERMVKSLECKDRETVDKLDRACRREFRKWMNSLYESGAVKYVEEK